MLYLRRRCVKSEEVEGRSGRICVLGLLPLEADLFRNMKIACTLGHGLRGKWQALVFDMLLFRRSPAGSKTLSRNFRRSPATV